MKQKTIQSSFLFCDPEHEAHIANIRQQLLSKVQLHGEQDGKQEKPNTPEHYQASIVNYIQMTVQGHINEVQQKYQPISGLGYAKQIEIEADRQKHELQKSVHNDQHKLRQAEHKAANLKPDLKVIMIRRWVFAGIGIISATEGITSFVPFRHVPLSAVMAIIAAISVAIGTSLGAHFGGGYLKTSRTRLQYIFRFCIVMAPAIGAFSLLGFLRAKAFNRVPAFDGIGGTVQPQSILSAVTMAAISIIFFWIALIASAKFFKTDAESKREQEYEDACQEVSEMRESIQQKENQIADIQAHKMAEISLAYKRFEYALGQERGFIAFASLLSEEYKQKNLLFRDDCPDFFCTPTSFTFITFFTPNTKEYETA
jgi:hypothetical protein